jgi:hypothetical protein
MGLSNEKKEKKVMIATLLIHCFLLAISFGSVFTWFVSHWALVLLILNELMALLPMPYNGILQSIIRILNLIFTKKSNE